MVETPQATVPLGDVLEKEQEQIEAVRNKRSERFNQGTPRNPARAPAAPTPGRAPTEADEPSWQRTDKDWVDVIQNAHDMNLVGLAFSGGGIRSATFNLGVLQALADLKLLFRVDYLSTVSGGGYIGAWLAAWTKRLGSFAEAQKLLSAHRVHLSDDKEQPPVRFLRVFSNYLTPKLGIFSGDTWAMIAIYLRNLLLNQTIVLALVATFLLLPRVAKMGTREAMSLSWIGYGLMGAVAVLLLVAFRTILINMGYLDSWKRNAAPRTEQTWILWRVCAPLFAAAVVAALWIAVIWRRGDQYKTFSFRDTAMLMTYHPLSPCKNAVLWLIDHLLFPYRHQILVGTIAYSAIWVLAYLGNLIFGERIEETETTPHPRHPGERFIKAGATLGAGALGGWLFALLSSWQAVWQDKTYVLQMTVGVPLVVGAFLLTGVLHIGLMGTVFHDWKREWWGRLGGWLLLFAITWLTLFWVALCFPDFITKSPQVSSFWKEFATKCLTPAWILSTIGTVLASNSKATGKPGAKTGMDAAIDAAIKVGPYIFIAGLLCWISLGMNCLLLTFSSCLPKVLFAGAVVATLVLMAWRVDINQFSMHMFYRNRLVSCFLGASRENRSPNRFTGFDPSDDLHLKDFQHKDSPGSYDGPYPVLNASLNLVKGKDLAWQERKAESFVMTPHFCGYDVWLEVQDSPMLNPWAHNKNKPGNHPAQSISREADKDLEQFGYCHTEEYAFPSPFYGPNLGLAMAISGAAASPNMGFYSSTPVAFLMTVFNVRLGQWLGNPRNLKTSRQPTPRMALKCLVNELLGGTNDESDYVYLSDGGHFDNMGLYELVKRRCGLIILCDAEADEKYTFSGLGNAIRKCRIDLGIDIDLDTSAIVPGKKSGLSKEHCAIGTIHYENADRDAPTGTIIYFKASLTGNESADVRNYKKAHAAFPHESTVNQWFSESQFESYRQLGYQAVFSSIRNTPLAPHEPLENDLHTIFNDYGFEVD